MHTTPTKKALRLLRKKSFDDWATALTSLSTAIKVLWQLQWNLTTVITLASNTSFPQYSAAA